MHRLLPPVCFLLAIALLVTGFALLSYGSPEVGVELHRARADLDQQSQDVLEEDLARRQWIHRGFVGAVFALSVILVVTGFLVMRP